MARTDITTNKRLVVRDMGKSGSFDGTTSFCTVPITPSTTAFSFGMWLKLDRGIGNNARILDWQESGPTNGFTYLVTLTGSRISIQPRFYNAGSLDGQPTAYEPNTNDWVHTVVTYEPNSLKFYINGTLWSQDTSITMNASATTLTLGKRTGGGFSTGYKGLIDGFTFVNGRAMTADEVTSLYTAGQHPDDTTCHIRFNDNVNDETKNKNNLTATSLTYSTNVPITTRSTSTVPRRSVENLLFNGDFEYAPPFTAATNTNQTWIDGTTGTSASPRTWGWCFKKDVPAASGQFDNSTSKTGTYSLKLSTLAANTSARADTFRSTSALTAEGYYPVLSSTSYTVSGWIKTNLISGSSKGAFIRAQEFSGTSTTALVTNETTAITNSTDWTYYSKTFTTGATTKFLAIGLVVTGTSGTANLLMDAWFDDIRLTKTTPDTRTAA